MSLVHSKFVPKMNGSCWRNSTVWAASVEEEELVIVQVETISVLITDLDSKQQQLVFPSQMLCDSLSSSIWLFLALDSSICGLLCIHKWKLHQFASSRTWATETKLSNDQQRWGIAAAHSTSDPRITWENQTNATRNKTILGHKRWYLCRRWCIACWIKNHWAKINAVRTSLEDPWRPLGNGEMQAEGNMSGLLNEHVERNGNNCVWMWCMPEIPKHTQKENMISSETPPRPWPTLSMD